MDIGEGIFVRAVHARHIWQGGELVQRSEHLPRRSFKKPPAAACERVSPQKRRGGPLSESGSKKAICPSVCPGTSSTEKRNAGVLICTVFFSLTGCVTPGMLSEAGP